MRALFLLGYKMKKLLLVLVSILAPTVAWATTLNDIRFSELPGERFEVSMTFSGPPPEPSGYTIERPARIVLDFPQVVSTLKERRFPLSFDNGQSAMVLTSEGRTRLVLNLRNLSSYETRSQGNTYVVVVGANDGGSVATPASNLADSIPGASTGNLAVSGPAITSIDFRRGNAGEGRIIVGLSDAGISADMADIAAGVRLSFNNVHLPA